MREEEEEEEAAQVGNRYKNGESEEEKEPPLTSFGWVDTKGGQGDESRQGNKVQEQMRRILFDGRYDGWLINLTRRWMK